MEREPILPAAQNTVKAHQNKGEPSPSSTYSDLGAITILILYSSKPIKQESRSTKVAAYHSRLLLIGQGGFDNVVECGSMLGDLCHTEAFQ